MVHRFSECRGKSLLGSELSNTRADASSIHVPLNMTGSNVLFCWYVGWILLVGASGCSAPEVISRAAESGKHLTGSIGSYYSGMAGSPEEDAKNIAGYSMKFRDQHERWPTSLRELTQFVGQNGEQLWPRRLENLKFQPKEDGRLVIFAESLPPGYDDSNGNYGSRIKDTAVILITPDGNLRLEIDPSDLKKYE